VQTEAWETIQAQERSLQAHEESRGEVLRMANRRIQETSPKVERLTSTFLGFIQLASIIIYWRVLR